MYVTFSDKTLRCVHCASMIICGRTEQNISAKIMGYCGILDGIEAQYWRPPSYRWPALPLDPSQSFLEKSLQQNLRDLDQLSRTLMASAGTARQQDVGHGSLLRASQETVAQLGTAAISREQSSSHGRENRSGTFTIEAADSEPATLPRRPAPLNLSGLR